MPPEQDTPGAGKVKRLFSWNYLSDAPQAEPHAVGASAGLSAEPQPVPQAEEVPVLLFQPDKFESAIFVTSCFFEKFSSLQFLFYRLLHILKVRTFLLDSYFIVSFV